jgi:hypothetical protein
MTQGPDATGEAAPRHPVAFTAPSAQVLAILDAAEAVRVRLVLFSATVGDQHDRQRHLLAGELRALGQCERRYPLGDPTSAGFRSERVAPFKPERPAGFIESRTSAR